MPQPVKKARTLSAKNIGMHCLQTGHLSEDDLSDIFYDLEDGKCYSLTSKRIHTKNTHGTGCTMSSAFASMLAKGMSLPDAAKAAKDFINGAILSGKDYEIGHGFGPVNHLYLQERNGEIH